MASRLRQISFAFGVTAALLAFLGAVNGLAFFAAGVGALTTIAGGVAALSNIERHTQLATKYSEIVDAIGSLLGQHESGFLVGIDRVMVEPSRQLRHPVRQAAGGSQTPALLRRGDVLVESNLDQMFRSRSSSKPAARA
jgi:hypothetical protein